MQQFHLCRPLRRNYGNRECCAAFLQYPRVDKVESAAYARSLTVYCL